MHHALTISLFILSHLLPSLPLGCSIISSHSLNNTPCCGNKCKMRGTSSMLSVRKNWLPRHPHPHPHLHRHPRPHRRRSHSKATQPRLQRRPIVSHGYQPPHLQTPNKQQQRVCRRGRGPGRCVLPTHGLRPAGGEQDPRRPRARPPRPATSRAPLIWSR